MPPEPIIDPAATRLSKSIGSSSRDSGRQPPDGPPSWTALKRWSAGMPPPMSKMTWRSVTPIGTSMRPPLATLPVREKIFVPLEVGGSRGGEGSTAPCLHDPRHVGVGLDVVDVGRLAEEAFTGGVRRPRARHAAPAFEARDQGRLLAADEGAGALADVDVEGEARAEDVVSQEATLAGLGQGATQTLDRELVFVPHVDVALARADGEGGDDHALDDRVRVSLEHRAIHERAGVAFVGVADRRTCIVPDAARVSRHFLPVEKPAPPRPRRPDSSMISTTPSGSSSSEHLGQRTVAASGQVVVDRAGVDLAVERQHPAPLPAVEGDLVRVGDGLPGRRGPCRGVSCRRRRCTMLASTILATSSGRTRGYRIPLGQSTTMGPCSQKPWQPVSIRRHAGGQAAARELVRKGGRHGGTPGGMTCASGADANFSLGLVGDVGLGVAGFRQPLADYLSQRGGHHSTRFPAIDVVSSTASGAGVQETQTGPRAGLTSGSPPVCGGRSVPPGN